MRAMLVLLAVILAACTSPVPTTTSTTLVNSTLPECTTARAAPVQYSYSQVGMRYREYNATRFKTLSYEVEDYEKVSSYRGWTEYVFFPNSRFIEFSNALDIVGIYEKTGGAEIAGVLLNQTIRVRNTDDRQGIFLVERIFPGMRSGYFLRNSTNVQPVSIMPGEAGEVTFDQGVMCHSVAEVSGPTEVMPYFIEHAGLVADQKDFIVIQMGTRVFACERAHYRIIPPKVKYTEPQEFEESYIINEQGTDIFSPDGRCD